MSGIKYILRNECTSPALITYQNYSNQLWQYQVEFLPGQTRTIWATEGTLSYDLTKTCIKVLSKTVYPSTSTTPSQPSTNPNVSYTNQYLIQVSTMATSNNFEYSVLNYQNATIVGPIDLGFSTDDDWYLDSNYDTLNGWMLLFFNNSTDDKKVYFINKTGTINYVYEADTNNIDYDANSNRFSYFTDYDNNVFIFSDFSTTYTYDIPSNFDDFYVDYNYDDGNYVGIIVYQEINSYSEYILFKPSGYQTLFNYNNGDNYVDSIVYYKSNFFGILVYSQNNNEYSFYNVYNSNGVLINSINLETNSLTSVNSVTYTPTVSSGITGTFDLEPSTTSGSGTGVTVQVSITTGTVNSVTLYGRGSGYSIGDTITINGSEIGGSSGVDNITLTVSSLGNFSLSNYDIIPFGDGKINMMFWDFYDDTVPYFIVIYDGISNEFYTTSHDHNALLYEYNDWFQYYSYIEDYSAPEQVSNDFHINFNDDNGGFNDDFYTVDDCDIVSWFDSTKEFSVYEFAKDNGYVYSIALFNYYVGKSLILYADRDNGYISYEIFQPTGHTSINIITTSVLDSQYINNNDSAGDKFVSEFDLPSSGMIFINNYDGTQVDTLYFDNDDYDWYTAYNSFTFTDYTNELSYYWNTSVSSILPTPFYDTWDDINYYTTTSNKNNGQQLLFNDNNYTSQILTQNTLSVVRTLPILDNNYSIRITKNLVALRTENNIGRLVVYVYDLNYNLLNTVTTNETIYSEFSTQENRIYLQTEGPNNTYVHYLITANTFRKVVTSDYSDNFEFNDWN